MDSTASSADRPRSGADAACDETPEKVNLADRLANVLAESAALTEEVPVDDGIHIIKETCPHHIDLSRAAFLSRRAEKLNCARGARALQPFFNCYRRAR